MAIKLLTKNIKNLLFLVAISLTLLSPEASVAANPQIIAQAKSPLKELPRTGLPLLGIGLAGLLPAGLLFKRFMKRNSKVSESAGSVWMEKQFKS